MDLWHSFGKRRDFLGEIWGRWLLDRLLAFNSFNIVLYLLHLSLNLFLQITFNICNNLSDSFFSLWTRILKHLHLIFKLLKILKLLHVLWIYIFYLNFYLFILSFKSLDVLGWRRRLSVFLFNYFDWALYRFEIGFKCAFNCIYIKFKALHYLRNIVSIFLDERKLLIVVLTLSGLKLTNFVFKRFLDLFNL